MPSKPISWRRRAKAPAAAFTLEEDAELKDMVRIGLDCNYYQVGLPDRGFGEILERRLQLIENGQLQRAREI
jgi:hypothetical protein|tara:strand:+ start:31225 stop:31440 length:216 start_codon:yes stop_codon:yes gene_type:complete